ncbi:DUF6446 family protein [Actibacterium pelagium]|uniref:Histidine kinase n=1 Tax=Actibacterium pelagium TaxID=2029103 RepID=A0A917AEK9_9RHOB|nr:DUF6446 family protein [Actibacterium pelagium]GGE47792.1 hypothetical protein GCM10011517_14500 [Actibacterium pelagium]
MAGLTWGKFMVGSVVVAAIAAGVGVWYTQERAFYAPVAVEDAKVEITSITSGKPEVILTENLTAIDSESSPIRYRACFTTPTSLALLTETYEVFDRAVPLVAPDTFDCFNAAAIGEALESEEAIAFMGEKHIEYGIDRIVAVYPDGRGFVWNQVNSCGKSAFSGNPLPLGCPLPPEKN